jgi:two-component system, chemotaxis family, chemotaxis protein CheY
MPRILIIDDDPDVRRLLKVALEKDQHEILEAAVVITDLMMPGKDGLDTLFELVTEDPRVKVIAMTGGNWREAVDRLHDARLFGAVRTVAKPFTLSEMLRVVGEVLAG